MSDLKTKLELLTPQLRNMYMLRNCTVCRVNVTDLELEKCIDEQILCVCDVCRPEFQKRIDKLANGMAELLHKGIK